MSDFNGQLSRDFVALADAGCMQTEPGEPLFLALWVATGGNPCDGCPEYRGGNCRAYQRHHTDAINETICRKSWSTRKATTPPQMQGSRFSGMSVKQIAERLGISKNEVRRRKTAGTLDND
jgi:hypothetical protein